MDKIYCPFIIILLCLSSIPESVVASEYTLSAVDNIQGVVVRAHDAAHHYSNVYGRSNVDGWTPDDAVIQNFENQLAALLNDIDDIRLARIKTGLAGYTRQYLGVIDQGVRLLFVQFACEAPESWKQQVFLVSDGGDCFFEIVYDVQAGVIKDYSVHGES